MGPYQGERLREGGGRGKGRKVTYIREGEVCLPAFIGATRNLGNLCSSKERRNHGSSKTLAEGTTVPLVILNASGKKSWGEERETKGENFGRSADIAENAVPDAGLTQKANELGWEGGKGEKAWW